MINNLINLNAITPAVESSNLSNMNINFYQKDQQSSITNITNISNQQTKEKINFDNFEILNKVFIGGINYKTDEQTFKNFFSKFGTLVDSVIIRDKQTRASKGFGFVKYSNSSMVDELMKQRPIYLDGRRIEVKRASPKSEFDSRASKDEATDKIYIGNINENINESDLREYFSQFGNILDVLIKRDNITNKLKGYAFIKFDDYDAVDKIILLKNHFVKSVSLEVNRAKQRKQITNDDRFSSMKSSNRNMTLACFNCMNHQMTQDNSSLSYKNASYSSMANVYGSYSMSPPSSSSSQSMTNVSRNGHGPIRRRNANGRSYNKQQAKPYSKPTNSITN